MSADGSPSAAVTAASGGGGDDDGSRLPAGGTTADAETSGPDSHVRCWDNMILTHVDIFLVGPRYFVSQVEYLCTITFCTIWGGNMWTGRARQGGKPGWGG